ncbi:ATP-binding protein [Roseospira goensis]|uniref:histidine kinase n=1 Tax=Roseospira goensis TaxID=391922 RepID=A0A7W6WL67_9PROT|nr:ATP-binding protein [Roseospira goensis]MBB4286378.1 light-regulated signal transduction histidine kinase (bacteriophytochrome) [Roseospira goensis]
MSDSRTDLPTVDLSECENEPIHLLELVQGHGCLLVLGGSPLAVLQASQNTEAFLGTPADALLGRPLSQVLDPLAVRGLEGLAAQAGRADLPPLGVYARPPADRGRLRRLRATAHRADTADGAVRLIVDLEPVDEHDEEAAEATFEAEGIAQAGLTESENLYQFLDQAVHAIAGVTDYDRVMAYMFHPDWSGEVVAEARNPDLTPFLGLRYPASDIPSQARRLYLSTLLRVIADVNGLAVPLTRADSVADDGPLDLSRAVLRSVSSYHIEYLRNMGVGATLVTSLVIDGALWGLIACHHMGPKTVPWHRREAVARLTARTSDRIGDILSLQRTRQERRSRRFLEMVQGRLGARGNPLDVLFFGGPRLSDVIRCDGIAVHSPDRTATTGNTPAPRTLAAFFARAAAHAENGVFVSQALADTHLFDDLDLPGCRGALVAFPSREPLVALACFRDELVREVHWGGDPNKPVEVDAASQRLSPRKSFNLWREEVRGHSRAWEPWTLDLMRRLADTLARGLGGTTGAAPDPAAEVAALAAAMDDLLDRFERRAGNLLESLDLADNGALLATPQSVLGWPEDVAVAANAVFRDRFDVDEGDIAEQPVKTVLRALGLPGTITHLPPGGSMEVEWWSGVSGHRTLHVLRRGLFALARGEAERAWVIYAFDDVTSFYRTQKALGAARTQAMARTRGRTEFLAQLARELRAPLHAIQGFADSLTQDRTETHADRYRDYAGEIRSLSGNLLDLLNDLLDVARLEGGGEPGGSGVFDLTLLVGDICREVRDSGRDHGMAWDWHLPNERILVQGDVGALRHALATLITAALRASLPDGPVMVRLTMERGGEPRVSVSDTGLGLGEDDLIALRRPLDATLAHGGEPHRGIGLALVRGLVDLHGGGVTVTSNPDSGTTVHVTLPRHRVVDRDNLPGGGAAAATRPTLRTP